MLLLVKIGKNQWNMEGGEKMSCSMGVRVAEG